MGILPYMVLCNAALCVFHISLLKVALSKVFDPDIEMKGKSGAGKANIGYGLAVTLCKDRRQFLPGDEVSIKAFLSLFPVTKSPFCGATGTVCFG